MATTIALKNTTITPIPIQSLGGVIVPAAGGSYYPVVPEMMTEVEFVEVYGRELSDIVDAGDLQLVVDDVVITDPDEVARITNLASLEEVLEEVPQRVDFVLVKSLADLPTPAGGIITLAPNTLYQINGEVNVGENQIVLSDATHIWGYNDDVDTIVYEGDGTLFSAVNARVTFRMFIVAAQDPDAHVFDIACNANSWCYIKDMYFDGCPNLGSITGGDVVLIAQNEGDDCGDGFEVSGSISDLSFIENMFWFTKTDCVPLNGLLRIPSGGQAFGNIEITGNHYFANESPEVSMFDIADDVVFDYFDFADNECSEKMDAIIKAGRILTIDSAPSAAGSEYHEGDMLTGVGGTEAVVEVTGVTDGAVTEVTLRRAGKGYTSGTGVATTGGNGTGCKINILTVSAPASQVQCYTPGVEMSGIHGERDSAGKVMRAAIRCATIAPLPSYTASGHWESKILTAIGDGALIIDGISVVVHDRVLIKDETEGQHNGIHRVVDPGGPSAPWILQRANDFNEPGKVFPGVSMVTTEGTTNGGNMFTLVTPDPIIVGITELHFDLIGSVDTLPFERTGWDGVTKLEDFVGHLADFTERMGMSSRLTPVTDVITGTIGANLITVLAGTGIISYENMHKHVAWVETPYDTSLYAAGTYHIYVDINEDMHVETVDPDRSHVCYLGRFTHSGAAISNYVSSGRIFTQFGMNLWNYLRDIGTFFYANDGQITIDPSYSQKLVFGQGHIRRTFNTATIPEYSCVSHKGTKVFVAYTTNTGTFVRDRFWYPAWGDNGDVPTDRWNDITKTYNVAVTGGDLIFTNGSATVTSTTNLSAQISIGDYLYLAADGLNYTNRVDAVLWDSGTLTVTLRATYQGTGGTGTANVIHCVPVLEAEMYTKHLVVRGMDADSIVYIVLGQAQYSSLEDAEEGPLPSYPDSLLKDGVKIATIIVKVGDTDLTGKIYDCRPLSYYLQSGNNGGIGGGGVAGDHSLLSHLDVDDHGQYLLTSGGRPIQGIQSYRDANTFTGEKEVPDKKYVDDKAGAAQSAAESTASGYVSAHNVQSAHGGIVQTSGAQSVDGKKTFSTFPETSSNAPTTDYQVANKKYVDDQDAGVVSTTEGFATGAVTDHNNQGANAHSGIVQTSGHQTVNGIKTFGSFPVTPSDAPSSDYQTANKKYVDDQDSSMLGSANGTAAGYVSAHNVQSAHGGIVQTSGAQSVDGIKTFTSIPILPATDPTTVNQAVRKQYVDDRTTIYYAESEIESNYNTNTNYQTKTTLTFTAAAADYLLEWSWEYSASVTIQDVEQILDRDAGTTLADNLNRLTRTYAQGQYMNCAGFKKVTLTAGSHTFTIQYKTLNTACTAYIRRARITARRVT